MLNRREVLAAGTMLGATMAAAVRPLAAAPAAPAAAPDAVPDAAPDAVPDAADLAAIAREAWLYAVPLIEIADVRRRILATRAANRFHHNRNPTNITTQTVTSPNNDTMYSSTILDLRAGPVTLTLPPTGRRYISLQLTDMFSNNLAVLGTRTTGGNGGKFIVAAPGQSAPPDAIRAPAHWVFALARILVDGAADVAAVRALQDGLLIAGHTGPPFELQVPDRAARWQDYFAAAGQLLVENPPPATDAALLQRIAPIGLTRAGFRPPAFSAAQTAAIANGVAAARAFAAASRLEAKTVDGWAYQPYNTGRFEQDYPYRAQTAVVGLFALPIEEAFYARSIGDGGPDGLFHGDSYRLHFAADALPPVAAFWSLTMYEVAQDGRFWFTANAIDRYAIGDRTAGLQRNPDGSLDIWISRADPGAARRANWLPAPASGPFVLSLRAFLPRSGLLNGIYRYPPVRPA